MKTLTQALAGMVLALVLALAPTQVAAQDMPDRGELETFTEAYVEIAEIRNDISPELAQATSPEEANQIQQQANERMTQVLEEKDMTVDRYSAITTILNSDAELRAEFEQIYNQMTSP